MHGFICLTGANLLVDNCLPLLLCMLVPISHFTALQTSGPHFVRKLFIRLQGVMCKTVKYDSCSYYLAVKKWCWCGTRSVANFVHV